MKKIPLSNSTIKIGLILILILLFLIPVSLIKNLISDRNHYQREALQSITEPLGGETQLQGLVIAVPYKTYKETYSSNGSRLVQAETKYILFAPDTYTMDISVNPYYLTRGIF